VMLALVFLPVHLLGGFCLDAAFSTATFIAGVWLTDRLYWAIGRSRLETWDRKAFLRMGMAVVLVTSAAVYAANLWFY